jgi:hypothetical protein
MLMSFITIAVYFLLLGALVYLIPIERPVDQKRVLGRIPPGERASVAGFLHDRLLLELAHTGVLSGFMLTLNIAGVAAYYAVRENDNASLALVLAMILANVVLWYMFFRNRCAIDRIKAHLGHIRGDYKFVSSPHEENVATERSPIRWLVVHVWWGMHLICTALWIGLLPPFLKIILPIFTALRGQLLE